MNQYRLKNIAENRNVAEQILYRVFRHQHFYDEQWFAIQKLLLGERILMIERTGFGKSLCYQFPAVLFDGLTVIFSPLIALMRDQVLSLKQIGIEARCINSEQNIEENEQAINDALQGKLKILYIAPERQENQQWIEATRRMRLSMIVVDEAHTISVWGHDFRPAFRRIVNLVKLLPMDMPILATTATATIRVQHDIEAQIGRGIQTIRGNLLRENFKLHVIQTSSEEEKMIWLAKHLKDFQGTGLIYTGTRVDTDNYEKWLRYVGIEAIGYNAGLDATSRQEIEQGLKSNKWKCVVSTNALGMGIDKPDIRFIIHTQIPASPIHYYQEIGRAGRDGKSTQIVLFYNSAKDTDGIEHDYHLPKAFIDGAKPGEKQYRKVIEILQEELLGERELIKRSNLKQTQIRVIKADLIERGIIKEVLYGKTKKYEYQFNAPDFDYSGMEQLRAAKMKDLDSMVEYVKTSQPRMRFLCDFLGDSLNSIFENCDNTTEAKWYAEKDEDMLRKIQEFRETYFPVINVEERNSNIINGVAGSYYGVSMVGASIHRSKYENGGDFPDYLLRITLKAFGKTFGKEHIDLVMYVPPTISGTLVERFAEKFASVIKVPLSKCLTKTRETQAQKIFHNAYSKRDNVLDSFTINGTNVNGMTILLIDDIYDSGATLKEIGRLLTREGAAKIIPVVIAKTVGNDGI